MLEEFDSEYNCPRTWWGRADMIRIPSHKMGSLGTTSVSHLGGVILPLLRPPAAPLSGRDGIHSSSRQPAPSQRALSPPSSPSLHASSAAVFSKASVLLCLFSLPGLSSLTSPLKLFLPEPRRVVTSSVTLPPAPSLTPGWLFPSLDHLALCAPLWVEVCPH